jgi:O-antigen ligase
VIPGSFQQITKRAPLACIVLVTASVLVFQPGGLYRFVWAKTIILALAVIFGLLSTRGGSIPRLFWLLLSAMAAWLLLAGALSDSPEASLMGRWPRYEGLPVLAVYLGLFAVGARVLAGPQTGSRWKWLRLCLSGVSLVLLALSALEAAGPRPLGGSLDSRPGATLGNASDQGLVAVLSFGLLLAPAGTESVAVKWTIRSGRAASVLVALLSGSRAALIGVVLLLIAALVWRLRESRGNAWSIAGKGLLAAVVLGGAALLLPGIGDRLLNGETVSGRWLLWQQTMNLIGEHFWFGVGPSGFVDAFPRYLDAEWAREVGNDFPLDSPHMWVLQAATAGGIPVLVLALLACSFGLVFALGNIRSVENPGQRRNLYFSLFAVGACGTAMLTHFTSPGTTGLLAFVCGGILGTAGAHSVKLQAQGNEPKIWKDALRLAGIPAFAIILAVAIPAASAEWPMKSGVQLVAMGNMDAANDSFEAAHSLRSWDSDTALLAAQAFTGPAAEDDPAAASFAMQWAEKSLEKTPNSLEAGLALAIGQLNSGELNAAKEGLDHLIERAPFNEAAYIQRGIANFGLGDVGASIADLHAAAELAPRSGTPWTILARIYERTGDEAAAASALSHAATLKP